ncbi:hypothetical protein BKA82DRAFT_10279 [Pisolithus tinctorius]|uniref:Uncharacterized protein n=1 Tax=Pisolithus tinctorius Marx 270 TaxID=870435 RepID=A0A0C3NFU3_PISTI|nr:hypothetical protein BKA82DRAFT_10279 [Pisolithus tinctorius]KIN99884.1 hypothetical protein M404DRAFT_10279 [Pisolithus tinctorius Marx 270]
MAPYHLHLEETQQIDLTPPKSYLNDTHGALYQTYLAFNGSVPTSWTDHQSEKTLDLTNKVHAQAEIKTGECPKHLLTNGHIAEGATHTLVLPSKNCTDAVIPTVHTPGTLTNHTTFDETSSEASACQNRPGIHKLGTHSIIPLKGDYPGSSEAITAKLPVGTQAVSRESSKYDADSLATSTNAGASSTSTNLRQISPDLQLGIPSAKDIPRKVKDSPNEPLVKHDQSPTPSEEPDKHSS